MTQSISPSRLPHTSIIAKIKHRLVVFRHADRLVVGVTSAIALLLFVIALWPTLFTSGDPLQLSMLQTIQAPSFEHWFGTDRLGRDVYTRVIHGTSYSLMIGLGSMLISAVIGTLLGILAGIGNRIVDEITSRIFDIVSAFPAVLLAMLVVTVSGTGIFNIAVAIGISGIPKFARIVRAQTRAIRRADYVTQAVIFSRSRHWILLHHVLPNVLLAIPVIAAIDIGNAIIAVSGLSFLGLGPQPPTPEWGLMLADSRSLLRVAWWTGVFPGLAIAVSVITFTMLGRRLQHILEARQ